MATLTALSYRGNDLMRLPQGRAYLCFAPIDKLALGPAESVPLISGIGIGLNPMPPMVPMLNARQLAGHGAAVSSSSVFPLPGMRVSHR